eukprot:COSAG04_NODE_239_length_19076_cov_18.359138_5_plen_523_part_00
MDFLGGVAYASTAESAAARDRALRARDIVLRGSIALDDGSELDDILADIRHQEARRLLSLPGPHAQHAAQGLFRDDVLDPYPMDQSLLPRFPELDNMLADIPDELGKRARLIDDMSTVSGAEASSQGLSDALTQQTQMQQPAAAAEPRGSHSTAYSSEEETEKEDGLSDIEDMDVVDRGGLDELCRSVELLTVNDLVQVFVRLVGGEAVTLPCAVESDTPEKVKARLEARLLKLGKVCVEGKFYRLVTAGGKELPPGRSLSAGGVETEHTLSQQLCLLGGARNRESEMHVMESVKLLVRSLDYTHEEQKAYTLELWRNLQPPPQQQQQPPPPAQPAAAAAAAQPAAGATTTATTETASSAAGAERPQQQPAAVATALAVVPTASTGAAPSPTGPPAAVPARRRYAPLSYCDGRFGCGHMDCQSPGKEEGLCHFAQSSGFLKHHYENFHGCSYKVSDNQDTRVLYGLRTGYYGAHGPQCPQGRACASKLERCTDEDLHPSSRQKRKEIEEYFLQKLTQPLPPA